MWVCENKNNMRIWSDIRYKEDVLLRVAAMHRVEHDLRVWKVVKVTVKNSVIRNMVLYFSCQIILLKTDLKLPCTTYGDNSLLTA